MSNNIVILKKKSYGFGGSAGMLEVRQRWDGECFIQATAIKQNPALEPVPRVAQSTQLRQEKSQQVLPIIWKFLPKLLTRALERFRVIMVIKQNFFIEKETNFMVTKHHSSLLSDAQGKTLLILCVYLVQHSKECRWEISLWI